MADTSNSPLDWLLCFLCQKSTGEKLLVPGDGLRPTIELLVEFNEVQSIKVSSMFLERLGSTVGDNGTVQNIVDNIQRNGGKYHKVCKLNYNKQRLKRAWSKIDSPVTRPDTVRVCRSSAASSQFGVPVCMFNEVVESCSSQTSTNLVPAGQKSSHLKGKTIAANVKQFTDKLLTIALDMGDSVMIRKLSIGDVKANELFYHKACHGYYKNVIHERFIRERDGAGAWDSRYRDIEILELYALQEVAVYLNDHADSIHKAVDLQDRYNNVLQTLFGNEQLYNSYKSNHVSRFVDKLFQQVPGLMAKNEKKALCLYFKDRVSGFIKCADGHQEFLSHAMKVTNSIRAKTLSYEHHFTGEFTPATLESSKPPVELFVLLNMLINGLVEGNFMGSPEIVSLAEQITFNTKQKIKESQPRKTDNKRHLVTRETPSVQYRSLKLYSIVRSRKMFDVLYASGICLDYKRVQALVTGLAEAALRQYRVEEAVVPGILRKGLFTIAAKDNVDKNSRSTGAAVNLHATSISLFQQPTQDNLGTERNFPKYIPAKKITTALPENWTLNLCDSGNWIPSSYFSRVSTVNSSSDVLNEETMKSALQTALAAEEEWLQHVVAREADDYEEMSRSVYRSHHPLVLPPQPTICALLPILQESPTSVAMQRHTIALAKKALEVVNPDQKTLVDVADQPLYATCKAIQINIPGYSLSTELFLMGGLHIEQVLLDMHSQLVAGTGLQEVPDPATCRCSFVP